jgi:hypothetical protein
MRTLRSLSPLLVVFAFLSIPAACNAGVFLSVAIAPPMLPIYVQPVCPEAGDIWTPGYWGNGPGGYFWVPGTWVAAPFVGGLWTPGYWGFGGGLYSWHAGYWGMQVGFYGGVNYGFGYGGSGYQGGYWNHGVFNYNRSVSNVNGANFHNVYNRAVRNNGSTSRVSYNGGRGGLSARPTSAEQAAARGSHTPASALQSQHEQAASSNRTQLASVNHGRPAVAATARPGEFSGKGAVASNRAATNHAATNHAATSHAATSHAATSHAATNRAATNHAATRRASSAAHSTTARHTASQPARQAARPQARTASNTSARQSHSAPAAHRSAAPRATAHASAPHAQTVARASRGSEPRR